MELKGKVALVTGGGRGIGKSIALAFAGEGADVVVASEILQEVEDVARILDGEGSNALAARTDVTKVDDIHNLRSLVAEKYGRVDILVNNAGVVGKRAFIQDADDATWKKTIEVNLFGTYFCTKAFLPIMMEQRAGRIINIASISGKQPSPTNSAYCASKHAVIGLTRTVAAELGLQKANITVNAICPGVANTDMLTGEGMILDELARLFRISREDVVERFIKKMSIQERVIEPEEIAHMAVFLASDKAQSITGQAINVCGGSVYY